nr:MFS transporter [Hyella patelloides]
MTALFSYLQNLAYSSSMSAIVPKQHYARATAMGSIQVFSANIFAPALAGVLYYRIGFERILILDLITFLLAISSLLIVKIPQPRQNQVESQNRENIWQRLTMGCRYLFKYPGLMAILIFLLSSNLFGSASMALVSTSILARSGNDGTVLAGVQSAMGIGGLVGATVLSIWGGFNRRINGLLLGVGLQNIGQILLGLGRGHLIWSIAAFGAAFASPFKGSSNQAIWLSKVKPDIQGRVFATRYLIAQITTPIGAVIAGPLADRFFEPAMMREGALAGIFGGVFGTGTGAGIAMAYTLFSCCGLSLALIGYTLPILRNVEDTVPDYDRS